MSKQCIHCGNNPVSHFSAWVNNSFGVPANRLYLAVFGEKKQKFTGYAVKYALDILLAVFRSLGLVKMYKNPSYAGTARGRVLWEDAQRRGIDIHGLLFLGRHTDSYIARVKGRRIYFSGIPRPVYTHSGSDWWLDDKAILKEKLASAGLPVPQGGSFADFDALAARFNALRKPVVVKPRLGSRGRHTTTHIYTKDQLREAFNIAKRISFWVVMEEHLLGSVYRAIVVDGALIGVLRGDPPCVVGDGISTVSQLAEIKNKRKHEKVSDIILDERHKDFLARTGRDFGTVPVSGEIVDLLASIGVSYGGHSAEVTEKTHVETKRIIERAAAIVDDPIIGFDFIIPDIENPPMSQRWGIIECNSTPFINLHHDPVEGAPVNVAGYVWDYVERNLDTY